MIELARRIQCISESQTMAIANQAKAMAAEGIEVCDLSVGEPDFITPGPIREAAKAALDRGETKYAPVAGLPRLREAVAEKLRRENHLPYTAAQVLITAGGKQALFNILFALLNPGDDVLIPTPYWVSYPEMVRLAGATSIFLGTTEATDFKITPSQLDAAITPQTRALILNSPSNPTGSVYSEEELRALSEVIVDHRIIVISDEIYEKLLYDGRSHTSIGSLSDAVFELTVTSNGWSKAYAATGWRLGYAAGPEPVIRAAAAIQSHTTSGPTTFAQFGGIAALEGAQDSVEAMRIVFEERRNLVTEALNAIPGIQCRKPAGAFYAFPNIRETGLDSISFCKRLLTEAHVATVPGCAFGADANIRLSYATATETLENGLQRIADFVASL